MAAGSSFLGQVGSAHVLDLQGGADFFGGEELRNSPLLGSEISVRGSERLGLPPGTVLTASLVAQGCLLQLGVLGGAFERCHLKGCFFFFNKLSCKRRENATASRVFALIQVSWILTRVSPTPDTPCYRQPPARSLSHSWGTRLSPVGSSLLPSWGHVSCQ